jgi:glyoxylase-like metal-dependent hydrolase (beta-lactamase superfamily II)
MSPPGPALSRRGFCACCAGLAAAPFAAVASTPPLQADGLPQALELGLADMQRIEKTIWVAKLAPGLWLHTTTGLIDPGIWYPANGLVLERDAGALLIDTGWSPEQGRALLAWSRTALPRPITQAVATHFHRDRLGGAVGLAHEGVPTLAHPLTFELARSRGLTEPTPIRGFIDSWRFGEDCELIFPGAGHTWDNIVAWLPRQQVLFGGCFLKSATSRDLGNLADADVGEWRGSLQRVSDRCRGRRITVPGHGSLAGDPVARTLALLPG